MATIKTHDPRGRRPMAAGRALIVFLVCMLGWALIDAPTLKRASLAQPLGMRRTASLWILTPLAALSEVTQLSRAADAVSLALGRDPHAPPGGTIGPDPDPLPSGTILGDDHVPLRDSPIRRPTATSELRVAVVGDSLAVGLGISMERVLRPTLTRVLKQGRISTGLARLDYFDWRTGLRQIEDSFRPDLVVVMLGVNDNQSLVNPDGGLDTRGGSVEWPPAYEQRVEQFARLALNRGGHIVWVGLPVVEERDRWPHFLRQNDIYRRVAVRLPNTTYVDTWDRFAARDGGYTAFYHDGTTVEEIRGPDGIHFTGTGYDLVAEAVVEAAIEEFRLAPRVLRTA
jgi:lysophospholipase L1-like esterase